MSCPIETSTPAASPAHGWTPERKVQFLDRLAAHGNARAACRAVGLSAEAAYKLRRRDPLFSRGWAAALVLARENCTQVLSERAVEGVEEPIYYRGELIGMRRRYDSRLLLAHLARLDQLANEHTAGKDAGHFDELIAAIAERGEVEFLPDRAEHIAQHVENVEQDYRRFEIEMDLVDIHADLEQVEADRRTVATEARQEAAVEWDTRLQKKLAAVDALCAQPAPTRSAPATLELPQPAVLQPIIAALASTKPEKMAAHFLPCTLSTASTATLARTLAEPPPTWVTTPRSHFIAPRNAKRRRAERS